MSTMPKGVKIERSVPKPAKTETEISIPNGVSDTVRSYDDSPLVFMSLSGRRATDCAVDDWRGIAVAALARLREVEKHLEGLLDVSETTG